MLQTTTQEMRKEQMAERTPDALRQVVPRLVRSGNLSSRNRPTTDAIKTALLLELEKYRPFLDAGPGGVQSVAFTVKLMKDSGLPRVVLVHIQSESGDD